MHRQQVGTLLVPVPARPSLRETLAGHERLVCVAVSASAALFAVGIGSGQRNLLVYAVVILLGVAGVMALHRRVGLSTVALWGLMVFGVSHLAGETVPVGDGVLYPWWLIDGLLRYDNLQHAWGFGFVGLATWEALRNRLPDRSDDGSVGAGADEAVRQPRSRSRPVVVDPGAGSARAARA